MNTKLQRRLATATAFAATGILATSIAVAAWTTSGTGDGAATAGTDIALVVGASTVTDSMVPNGSGDVVLTIQNPNEYNVDVDSILLDDSVSDITSTSVDCDGDDADLTYTAPDTTSLVVGAGATVTVTIDDALDMGVDAVDECKGVTFTVPVEVIGHSSAATPSASAVTIS